MLRLFTALLAVTVLVYGHGSYADDQAPPMDPTISALLSMKRVGAPAVSPDGKHAAYIVSQADLATDSNTTDIWLVETATGKTRQLTYSSASESAIAWHPTHHAITFLTDRENEDDGISQVWLLPLAGGEARPITHIEQGVDDYVVAPSGQQLAVVATESDPFEAPPEDAEITTAPPIVIDRFAFKSDGVGYLTQAQHIYLVDLESGESEQLELPGAEHASPAYSPDGKYLAYVAKGAADPDRTSDYDVYLHPLSGRGKTRPAASSPLNDCGPGLQTRPVWHPDSSAIACISGDEDKDNLYAQYMLKLIELPSGKQSLLTEALDLWVYEPAFNGSGDRLYVVVEKDRTQMLASVATGGGDFREELSGPLSVSSFGIGGDRVVARIGTAAKPYELHTVEAGSATAITAHNAQNLAQFPWQPVEEISFNSADGTRVNGLLMLPANYRKGRDYPTVLWIHGGPTSQFAHEPRRDPQLFAAHGYAVLMINPRGSTGRGIDYAKGIYGAWGSVDVPDVLAGVDWAVKQGIADPDQLVIGGWSYGGMLTNYVIASDQRFKAAASGASISNAWAGFGTDMYIREYLSELGAPWENPEGYNRISYPFLHADRISTPTLFLVGEKDYNVPLLSSEQMYQALKVLNVPTRLVVYPGQPHSISVPSYEADIWQRHLDWFAEHLQ